MIDANCLPIAARPSSRAGYVPSGENICASSLKNAMIFSRFCDITALKHWLSVSRASFVTCDIEDPPGVVALEAVLQLARLRKNRNWIAADLRIEALNIRSELDAVSA